VRLVSKDGDVIWSTTQESNGGKFRSAMADVADKIVRQLADETRRMRDLAAVARDARPQVSDDKPKDNPKDNQAPDPKPAKP